MPSITVNGIPPEMSQDDLERLMMAMVEMAREMSDIEYAVEALMVWFPSDRMQLGLGHEFSIDVAGLDAAAGARSTRAANMIAAQFCKVIAVFFPEYWFIEGFVRSFKSYRDGYATLKGAVEPPKEELRK